MRRAEAIVCCILYLLPLMGLVSVRLSRVLAFSSEQGHYRGVPSWQADRTKPTADFDELFEIASLVEEPAASPIERPTTTLVQWPTVCDGSDNKPPAPDNVCCIPEQATAIAVTSTSPGLCSDGVRPVTILYALLRCLPRPCPNQPPRQAC